MSITNQVNRKVVTEIINLINGEFSKADAKEILISIIDKKINFHKVKKLATYEKNHHDPCDYDNGRIDQLEAEKSKLERLFEDSLDDQSNLQMHGQLIIQMENIDQ